MNFRFAAMGALLLLAACASSQPIYDVPSHPVPTAAQSLSLERIESAIVDAGKTRNWRFERVSLGTLHASQVQQKYSAEVEIVFNAKTFSIRHLSSTGMNETGNMVHPHYNMWVHNLEHDIETYLINAPLSR